MRDGGRPLGEIVRNPLFVVAVVCGVASYALMNLIMTSAPLAMVDCGHSVTDRGARHPMARARHVRAELRHRPPDPALWRVPHHGDRACADSGQRGHRHRRRSRSRISGSALALLGVGWNFAFIAATTLVTQCHRPEERNKVQAFNDFLIFGTMAFGSFASGKVLATLGWVALNVLMFPPVLAAGALLAWVALRNARRSA